MRGMRYDELAARNGLILDDVMAVITAHRYPLDLTDQQAETVRAEAAERGEIIDRIFSCGPNHGG